MKTTPRLFFLLPALAAPVLAECQSIGPSAINAAGGSASIAGNTYEYALGQAAAGNTAISASLIVTPGVLQPQLSTAGVRGVPAPDASLQLFPNPASTALYLQPAFEGAGTLQYLLYDAAGRLVLQREVRLSAGTERQTIDVAALAAGQYQLQINWKGSHEFHAAYKVQKIR